MKHEEVIDCDCAFMSTLCFAERIIIVYTC